MVDLVLGQETAGVMKRTDRVAAQSAQEVHTVGLVSMQCTCVTRSPPKGNRATSMCTKKKHSRHRREREWEEDIAVAHSWPQDAHKIYVYTYTHTTARDHPQRERERDE